MAPVEPSAFGILLRHYRVEAELTQEQLAERAHLSVRAISDLERGLKHTPRVYTVRQLADALGLEGSDRARFTAAARGEPERSPAVETQRVPRSGGAHNLPHLLTRFIGRQEELVEARRSLGEGRMLTLTGVGGCGKTRLALEIAGGLVTDNPDGVWLVELSSIRSAERVPAAVAVTLGIGEQPGIPLLETLLAQLEPRDLLLILDNCEHVLDACAAFADALLRRCPGVRILATSREPLRLPGEMIRRVAPLPVPDPEEHAQLDSLSGYASIQLLADRVRYRAPEFQLTEGNAGICALIARRLEGLPLALELAAARVGPFSLEQIAALLGDTLGVLTIGSRVAEPRQQTMRGALDWSYNLLDEEERQLFARLSVFAGGWTLEAAQVIGSAERISASGVVAQLSRLVDQSLIVADVRPNAGMRYRMLEPVRQYAHERLEESGEAEAIHRRHAELLLALAEAAEPELAGPNQEAWLERLWAEADNTRAALLWARSEAGDPVLGLRLAARFSRLLFHRGDLREARDWLESMLARADNADLPLRAKALQRLGVLALNAAETDRATIQFEQALPMFRAVGDEQSVAWTLAYLANLQRHTCSWERQKALLDEALPLARRIEDDRLIAVILGDLGTVADHEGDLERAIALYTEAFSMNRSLGNQLMVGINLACIAMAENRRGNHDLAHSHCREALEVFVELRNRRMIAASLDQLGVLAHGQGDRRRATRLFGAAAALRESCGAAVDSVFYDPVVTMIEEMRRGMGEDAFHGEWEVGQSMSLEDAIGYARESRPEHATRAGSSLL